MGQDIGVEEVNVHASHHSNVDHSSVPASERAARPSVLVRSFVRSNVQNGLDLLLLHNAPLARGPRGPHEVISYTYAARSDESHHRRPTGGRGPEAPAFGRRAQLHHTAGAHPAPRSRGGRHPEGDLGPAQRTRQPRIGHRPGPDGPRTHCRLASRKSPVAGARRGRRRAVCRVQGGHAPVEEEEGFGCAQRAARDREEAWQPGQRGAAV